MKYVVFDKSGWVENIILGDPEYCEKLYPGRWKEFEDDTYVDFGMVLGEKGFEYPPEYADRKRAEAKEYLASLKAEFSASAAEQADLAAQIARLEPKP